MAEDEKKVEEQDAVRRSLAKEAPAVMEPLPKKARVDDSSLDLVSLLTTSASVLDIFAASGSRPMTKEDTEEEVLGKGAWKDVSYEVGLGYELELWASPVSEEALEDVPSEVDQLLLGPTQGQSFKGIDRAATSRQTGICLYSILCLRKRKAYLSPALIWLEEEGVPTTMLEANEAEMYKKALVEKTMGKWKGMSMKKKAYWRKRAEQRAAALSLISCETR